MDIIIPVYNEEEILLDEKEYYQNLSRHAHLIFVDGESSDRTAEIASDFGDVVLSQRGRGIQKNNGLKASRSNCLLFLHVDTFIGIEVLSQIEDALQKNEISAGCMTLRINDQRPVFRLFEKVINFRAKFFDISDGDLGLFVKRDALENIGGFETHPIMEDLLIAKKIRRTGKFLTLTNPITVSSRKWNQQGFGKTLLQYSKAYFALWSGFRIIKGV